MRGALIIYIDELSKIELCPFIAKMEEQRIALKVITGYRFDNPSYYIENIFGDLFKFILWQEEKLFGLNIYNAGGQKILYATVFTAEYFDPVPKKTLSRAKLLTEEYSRGYIRCTHCGKKLKITSTFSYYAGSYCKKCWREKYKELAKI